MNKWDYTIKKITIRTMASWSSLLLSPCHHDHYDDHDQNYEERVYYVVGGALSVFCAQLAGMGFSLAPNQYTQNIHETLWGTVGNKQNRMLRIIGWTWSFIIISKISHCHYHHYHHNHNNHSLWECEQENTEIYGASLWECGQAKHRDILRGWRFGHSQPTKKHRMYRIYMIYRMYRIYRIYRMYRIYGMYMINTDRLCVCDNLKNTKAFVFVCL